ncbi:MAG: type III pantothenate kinase [bacterium]|nr:type III pantothenate kinase [bacterium]
MIASPKDAAPDPEGNDPRWDQSALIVIDVGNTSIALGAWAAGQVHAATRVRTSRRDLFANELAALCRQFPDRRPLAVVVASVVPEALAWIGEAATDVAHRDLAIVGQGIPLPIDVAVREPHRVGADRVCTAAAAYERTGHACTVIDFGTAVTIDLVDDAGTFLGGAILPGPQLQAKALAEYTAALPEVDPQPPAHPIGTDTAEAIGSGVCYGIAGAVRGIVERYATALNHWPQVVATGGQLELFLPECDFIDSAVPDLTLMGIGLAHARHRQAAQT